MAIGAKHESEGVLQHVVIGEAAHKELFVRWHEFVHIVNSK